MTNIVGQFAIVCLVFAFFLFLFKYKKNNKSFKIYTVYLGLISLCEVSSAITRHFHKNNMIIGHCDTTFQFILISLFFASMFTNQVQKKIVYFFLVLLPLILFTRFAIYPELLFKYDNVETFSTAMLLIVYATLHLYNMLNREKKFFYVTVGLLIYIVGSTTIVLTGNILIALNDMKLYKNIWLFNVLFYLIYQLFVIFEWYKNYRQKPIIS